MHERERHRIILDTLQTRPVATVGELVDATGGSEATIRRDLNALSGQGRLRKLRGGAEALQPSNLVSLDAHRGPVPVAAHSLEKRAIAREAVAMCREGDAIIINGGTTTFGMVHALAGLPLQVMTNSFSIADHLLRHSRCTVFVPSGTVYREQSLILSPFADDGTAHFRARRMFMGAHSVSALGIMESDALTISSEQRLMGQADELVLLVDATKFRARSAMILAPLSRAACIVTDSRITAAERRMIEVAGVRLVVADPRGGAAEHATPSTA